MPTSPHPPTRRSAFDVFRVKQLAAVPFSSPKMANSEKNQASPPPERRHVTEQELMETLNRSLWEVERRRVEETARLTP
jgi:hypothetical protein